ncbi:hypothetical protein GCM10022254_49440 [Actinomadura meridiana]|uniref:Uncharacterized protein n=1 Tax=Actinomadura meridiana TaxID=559626 RepID=A0ABP8CC49_9ACTN
MQIAYTVIVVADDDRPHAFQACTPPGKGSVDEIVPSFVFPMVAPPPVTV